METNKDIFIRLNDVTGIFVNRRKTKMKKDKRERIINIINNLPKYHTFPTKPMSNIVGNRKEGKVNFSSLTRTKSLEQKYAPKKLEAMRLLKENRSETATIGKTVNVSEKQTVPKEFNEHLWNKYFELIKKLDVLEAKRKYWEMKYKKEVEKKC
jgi:hypothetical protein